MMPSNKVAQMGLFRRKGVGRAIDKKYLQMKSPGLLVQNQNNFTEMVLMLRSTKIDQKVSLATRAKNRNILKSYISLATGPLSCAGAILKNR